MTTADTSNATDALWLKHELRIGLASLMPLGLAWMPAAELIPKLTLDAWFDACTLNDAWDRGRDLGRIRQAFRQIAATETDWPKPATFLKLVRNTPSTQLKLQGEGERPHDPDWLREAMAEDAKRRAEGGAPHAVDLTDPVGALKPEAESSERAA